jgi:uncharacterized membrane protein
VGAPRGRDAQGNALDDVSTVEARRAAFSMMLKAKHRRQQNVPGNAQFEVIGVDDPFPGEDAIGRLYVLHIMFAQYGGIREFFATAYGWKIFFGGMLGSLMWFNVWFMIWPRQRLIIGGFAGTNEPPGPEVAAKAAMFSRINAWLSIPMIFLMVASSHLSHQFPSLATLFGS